MKKRFLLLGAVLGLALCVGLGTGSKCVPAFAEGEEEVAEPAKETYTIAFSQPEHGKVLIAEEDLEGEVGKEVTIDIQPSMFYLIKSVSVNGTALVESETTKGLYVFKQVAGENVLVVEIATDHELIKEFNILAQDVKNKDWASIFSVETVVRLLGILLNSSLLVAMVAYFVRDKRLSAAVEKKTQETLEKLVPAQTKDAVINAIKEQIAPIFEENKADMLKVMQALSVFSRCMALAQENNAESRKAILDELASLEIGDMATIQQIKDFIHDEIVAKQEEYERNMARIREIEAKNAQNVAPVVESEPKAKEKQEKEEERGGNKEYDGSEI